MVVYRKIALAGRIRNSSFSLESLVSRISDKGILGMSLLANQKCTLCPEKDVLSWRGDAIPSVDKDGRVLANRIQVLQPTTLLPGMEAQVCCRLVSEPNRSVGFVENGICGDTRVMVAATICRPGRVYLRPRNFRSRELAVSLKFLHCWMRIRFKRTTVWVTVQVFAMDRTWKMSKITCLQNWHKLSKFVRVPLRRNKSDGCLQHMLTSPAAMKQMSGGQISWNAASQ